MYNNLLEDIFVDLDTMTVKRIKGIVNAEDILNSAKVILVDDVIAQERKVKSSLITFTESLQFDLLGRIRYLKSKRHSRVNGVAFDLMEKTVFPNGSKIP